MNATDTATIKELFQNVAVCNYAAEYPVGVLQERLRKAIKAKEPIREIESLIYRLGKGIAPMFTTEIVGTHIHEINIGEDWRKAPEWEAARFLMRTGSLDVLLRFDAKANKAAVWDVASKAHSVIIQKVVPSISSMFLFDRMSQGDCNHPLLFDLIEWMSREKNQSDGPSDLKKIDAFFKELGNCLILERESLSRFPYFGLEISKVAEESGRKPVEVEREFTDSLAKAFTIYLGQAQAEEVVENIIKAGFVEMLPYLVERIWAGQDAVIASVKNEIKKEPRDETGIFPARYTYAMAHTPYIGQLWLVFTRLWYHRIYEYEKEETSE